MRTKKGIVTSAGKIKNTVTVTVTRYVVHPIYQKRYPVSKKFLADTNGQEVKEGYVVMIGECRPLSKKKHFKIVEVLEKGLEKGVSLEEELSEASGKRKEGAEGTPASAPSASAEATADRAGATAGREGTEVDDVAEVVADTKVTSDAS